MFSRQKKIDRRAERQLTDLQMLGHPIWKFPAFFLDQILAQFQLSHLFALSFCLDGQLSGFCDIISLGIFLACQEN
jgi:hypothetical protein